MERLQKMLDSREVAEMTGKQHKNLLADIRGYVKELDELKIQPVDFFQEATYKGGNGQDRPCYLVTKKGCEFIAHKLTGIKGTEFTAKYINRFHEMEDELVDPRRLSVTEQIRLLALGNGELEERIDSVEKELIDFKNDMPLLGVEESRITTAVRSKGVRVLGGKDSNAYADKSLRRRVFSDIYRELKRQFQVGTYKAIKRSQCEVALEIINDYKPPLALEEEIRDCNAQESFVSEIA
ncbi:MAG: ORF6C domain-containing protein [Clostridiales bacterium]|nr:ORF6C domain-containing protein [Clostridiales bacterium]